METTIGAIKKDSGLSGEQPAADDKALASLSNDAGAEEVREGSREEPAQRLSTELST